MDGIRGTPDTDRLVLLELDDKSFTALCSVSRYTRSLCNENLWVDRFALKYGVRLWQYEVSHREVYIEFSKLQEYELLKRAIQKVFINLVEKLIENAKQNKLNTALLWASEYGNLDIVKLLLDRGANIHADNEDALRFASSNGHLEVVRLLLDRGADIHAGNNYALQLASENGHLEVVKLLLDRGANIHAYNDESLQLASYNGHLDVVRLLLDRGANVHARNDGSLGFAAQSGNLEVVRLLLDSGANIHVRNDGALRLASKNGHLEIVKLLLDEGADIHAMTDYAFRWASRNGHLEVVRLLLNRGATIEPISLKLASKNGYTTIVELLKSKMEEKGLPIKSVKKSPTKIVTTLPHNDFKQCSATTKAGNRCKKIFKGDGIYCSIHNK